MKERPKEGWWLIPPEMYKKFNDEFKFNYDPCPNPRPDNYDGLKAKWGSSNWVNPPFWAGITGWVRKALLEHQLGKDVVMILPLDNWVRLLIEAGAEIRSLGSHEWIHTTNGDRRKAPRPSFLFILKKEKEVGR